MTHQTRRKITMKTRKYVSLQGLAYLLFVVALAVSGGCVGHHCNSESSFEEKQQFLKKVDGLYSIYVNGSPEEARRSLLQAVNMLEQSRALEDEYRAGILRLEYCRWAVLENKMGGYSRCNEYLAQANYWDRRNSELIGKSPDLAETWNIAKCTELVEKMDRRLHNGKIANYNDWSPHAAPGAPETNEN